MRRRVLVLALVLTSACALAPAAGAAAPGSCGAPAPDEVVTGSFTTSQTGSYVFLPFDVPEGTTAIRAWYCHDQPELPTSQLPAYAIRHTLDLGLYEPRPAGQALWTMEEYRGWSGDVRDVGLAGLVRVAARDRRDRPLRPGPRRAGGSPAPVA